MDPNESFQDAARRETMEEAGLDVNLVTDGNVIII